MAEPRAIDLADLRPRLERAFDFAARQVRATIERTPDYFPIYTVGGRWKHGGRALDRLVRGVPRRDDVADRRARPATPGGATRPSTTRG